MGQNGDDKIRLEATDSRMSHHLARKIEEDEKKRKSAENDEPGQHENQMDVTDGRAPPASNEGMIVYRQSSQQRHIN